MPIRFAVPQCTKRSGFTTPRTRKADVFKKQVVEGEEGRWSMCGKYKHFINTEKHVLLNNC